MICRIEVDDGDWSLERSQKLVHSIAIGRLARTGTAYHQLSKRHGALQASLERQRLPALQIPAQYRIRDRRLANQSARS